MGNSVSFNDLETQGRTSTITDIMQGIEEMWSQSRWNRDLLNATTMGQLQAAVAFDAATGTALPPVGVDTWETTAPSAPVARIFAPWIDEKKKPVKKPVKKKEDPIEF